MLLYSILIYLLSFAGEEFLALSVEKVISLVQSDNLSVPSEEKVFESIIAWVNHDLPSRQEQVRIV